MKAHSTSDVSLDLLRELRHELAPEIELEVDDRQTFFKSAEPPSWVAFLAESEWWAKALAAYAALYVAKYNPKKIFSEPTKLSYRRTHRLFPQRDFLGSRESVFPYCGRIQGNSKAWSLGSNHKAVSELRLLV